MLRPPTNHITSWKAEGEFYFYPSTLCVYVVLKLYMTITNTPEHVQQKKWIHMAVTFHCVQCENTENHCFYTCLLIFLLT
jgi:hypothetical protein